MTDNEIQALFDTLSAGRTPGKQDFNASKMFSLLEDPFSIWCSFHAPKEAAVPETNRYENLKIRTDRHTRDQWIKSEFPGVVFVSGENETERFQNTLRAMAKGESAIANGLLWNLPESAYGSVNLLVRSDAAPSVFGAYHYHIYQFKRAHDLKEHYALQVSLLNHILGKAQQFTPATTRVFLKDRTLDVPYRDHQERLERELAFWRAIRDGLAKPEAHKSPANIIRYTILIFCQ